MKYYLSTEYNECLIDVEGSDSPVFTLELISIGIAAEGGRDFYRVLQEGDLHRPGWKREHCNQRTKEQVLPSLELDYFGSDFVEPQSLGKLRVSPRELWVDLEEFFAKDDPPLEIYSWNCAHSWVLFCQIFGGQEVLPYEFDTFCRDLRLLQDFGGPFFRLNTKEIQNALLYAMNFREYHQEFCKGRLVYHPSIHQQFVKGRPFLGGQET